MSISSKKNKAAKKAVAIDNTSFNILMLLLAAILVIVIVLCTYFFITKPENSFFKDNDKKTDSAENENGNSGENDSFITNYPFRQDISVSVSADLDDAREIENINSEHAVLVDVTDGVIVASKRSHKLIYPASLTKVMTLIVVYENLPNEQALDKLLEIKYTYDGNSGFGFKLGEKLTVEELIYAAVLQSDGVACLTLADYIAGSEAKFVELMNKKVEELGLLEGDDEDKPSTKFQNCTGLHEQDHYTTAYDMAVIMAYAMKNDYCANVLTSLSYKPTTNFREGGPFTFWSGLLHKYLADGNTQPTTATILGGKTGWAGSESGYCFVTYAKGKDSHNYILVNAKAEGWAACTQDALDIYNNYVD